MAADFDFSDGKINAVYYYDAEESSKIDDFREKYDVSAKLKKKVGREKAGEAPRLKAYSDMNEKEKIFLTEIRHIVDTSIMPLDAVPEVRETNRKSKHIYIYRTATSFTCMILRYLSTEDTVTRVKRRRSRQNSWR